MENERNRALEKNIPKFYFFIIPWTFWLVAAISLVFYQRMGLSISQISLIDAIWAATAFLLEVPSGVLSDRWSRKNMLVLSSLFAASGFLIFYFNSSIWPFIFATIFMASRWTFFSGTANALLYDTLIVLKREGEFEKILGKRKLFGMFSVSVAGIIGAYLAQYDIRFPYFLSFITSFIAAIVASTFVEPKIHTSTGEVEFWEHIKSSGKAVLSEPSVRFLMILLLVMSYPENYLDEYDQLYLAVINMPVAYFGIWIAIRRGLQGVGNAYADKVKSLQRFDYKKWSLMIIIFCLALIVWGNKYFGLLAFLIAFFVWGIAEVLVWGEVHRKTISSQRATVESLLAFLTTIVAIPSLLIFGTISDKWGIRSGYLFIFVILLVYLFYYVYNEKAQKTQ